jgi:alkanesulfonate monooxygenase SsuD/methylene tetrahydromethanopterin reductase-like flavin-dependent oxidoreductase (luciferase family)
MLALTGRLCDGWVPSSPYVPPEQLAEKNERIDEAASAVGRDPGRIRRIYNVMGHIAEGTTGEYLIGPVDRWVDELVRLVKEGMDTFIFAPSKATTEQIRLFGEEVVPRVREELGEA